MFLNGVCFDSQKKKKKEIEDFCRAQRHNRLVNAQDGITKRFDFVFFFLQLRNGNNKRIEKRRQ